ncbi:hypothetical protein D3C76_788260 [compost metagenome]
MLSHLMDLRLVTLASKLRPSMVKLRASPRAMPSWPASTSSTETSPLPPSHCPEVIWLSGGRVAVVVKLSSRFTPSRAASSPTA